MKRFLCWIGWHGPQKEPPQVVFYSNRSMAEMHRCPWCRKVYPVNFGS